MKVLYGDAASFVVLYSIHMYKVVGFLVIYKAKLYVSVLTLIWMTKC